MAINEKLKIKMNLVFFFVGAFALLWLMATQVLSILQSTYSVVATFPDAGGVFTDQEVTYRGITVGRVGEMKVVDEGVSIELIINGDEKIPAEGTGARVMFKSAVGEQFVDILPTADKAPYFEDGDTIPIERTSIPVSTQALLSTTQSVLEGVPPEALAGTLDSLAEGLQGEGADIALFIESMADLSEVFAARGPEVIGILRNGTKVGDAFLRSKDDFANALRDLVIVADILRDNTGNIEALMENSNLLSDELLELIQENRGTINQVIKELAEINEFQAADAEHVNRLLNKLPYGLAAAVKAFESKTGLVRFGLVQDTANPGCDYADVNRRTPQRRNAPFGDGDRIPPKHANCTDAIDGGGGEAETTASDSPAPTDGSGDSELAPEVESLIDVESLIGDELKDTTEKLPARMRDWSWAFLYLNGLQ
jgi:phospholipid/cholesterol/gamma-HCH transport system substrate-binding protein